MTETVTSAPPLEAAASLATRDVPIVRPADSIGAVRQMLSSRRFTCASHIVVCDEARFRGVIRIEDALAAGDDRRAADVMDPDAPTVGPGTDQEHAAWQAVSREESALSVVDASGRFAGLIPPDRMVRVLLTEHNEDMARLGGYMRASTTARLATEEPVHRRFWHRLPWLLVGLAGALLAADLVGRFEARLEEKILLAFFIPGIVYLADAVGTQTETVVVRGLSVGIPVRRIVGLELLSGLGLGLALAVVAGPAVLWRWGDADVALTVAMAVFCTSSIATVVAMVLPWLLDSLSADPAFGSGPLATVVQDLLSVAVYFLIAAAVIA